VLDAYVRSSATKRSVIDFGIAKSVILIMSTEKSFVMNAECLVRTSCALRALLRGTDNLFLISMRPQYFILNLCLI